MLGSDPFASVPFDAVGGDPLPNYELMLSQGDPLVYTAELTVWDPENEVEEVLYLANAEWATSPTDVPPNAPFTGRLSTVLSFSRSIIDNSRLGINHSSEEGSIKFSNEDGFYDDYIESYVVDRRPVIIRVGRRTDPFADHLIIFKGVATDWTTDDSSVTVTIKDEMDLLDFPAQPNLYEGTGDEEGGEDLEGKRKPRCFGGFVFGSHPTLIDKALSIYQVNDGPVDEITFIYDRGLPLTQDGGDPADYATLAASTPGAGAFIRSLALGMFKLGAKPDGVVFCTVVRPPYKTEDIIYDLLVNTAGLSTDQINYSSFEALKDETPDYFITYFLGPDDSSTIGELVEKLMAGLGGWIGFDRQGLLSLGRFTYPDGDPVAYFDRDDGSIIALGREELPSGVWPPPWRWRVAWKRNWTVFTDFAAAVSEDQRSIYAEPYRLASDNGSLDVKAAFPKAQDPPPIEAYFVDESHAGAEATRLLYLYGQAENPRKLYKITVGREGLHPAVRMGAMINVKYPRYGLSAGMDMRIVKIEDSISLESGSLVERVILTAYSKGI